MATEEAKRSKYVKRRAVIVGINAYKDPDNWLSGCVADAKEMYETLRIHSRYPGGKSNVKIIVDAKANKRNILAALEWAVKGLQKDDVLVFYYSGHGSYVVDENRDEPDRFDEIICCWDMDFDNPSTYITDDELHAVFSKAPEGVVIDAIFDSCHSGTVTRSLMPIFNADRKQKFIPPPPSIRHHLYGRPVNQLQRRTVGESVVRDSGGRGQRNTLWSACRDNQVAYELDFSGQIRGAFTYNFCRIIKRANGLITRDNIATTLEATMQEDGYDQNPTFEPASTEAGRTAPFRRWFEDESSEWASS